MSIKSQASFWLRNVNAYTGECGDSPTLADGCRAFSELLRKIFADYRSFEVSEAEKVQTKIGIMADDLENYHNLTETLDCLYSMVTVGVLREEGSERYLEIKKSALKVAFKGSVNFPFQMLERHGFYCQFFKVGKEASSYKNCDMFRFSYDNGANLILAMKYYADALPDANAKDDYIPKKNLFYLADFNSVLLKQSVKKTNIDPLKVGIMNTVGEQSGLWREIAEYVFIGLKLGIKACINPYVFPNWTIKFLQKKKTIVTFTISPDTIHVKLPLTYEMAIKVIQAKETLPQLFRSSIDRFGCCGCGKCSNQSNIEVFEGVSLCRLSSTNFISEDARSIAGNIVSREEVVALTGLIKEM